MCATAITKAQKKREYRSTKIRVKGRPHTAHRRWQTAKGIAQRAKGRGRWHTGECIGQRAEGKWQRAEGKGRTAQKAQGLATNSYHAREGEEDGDKGRDNAFKTLHDAKETILHEASKGYIDELVEATHRKKSLRMDVGR